MKRTNTFEVVLQSERADTVLRRLLDAAARLWNQLTYARRQRFFAGETVWDCDGYYDEYVDVIGSAMTQQITRVNDAAWRSFPCGFEGHADLVASRTLLEQATNAKNRPTARPVRS